MMPVISAILLLAELISCMARTVYFHRRGHLREEGGLGPTRRKCGFCDPLKHLAFVLQRPLGERGLRNIFVGSPDTDYVARGIPDGHRDVARPGDVAIGPRMRNDLVNPAVGTRGLGIEEIRIIAANNLLRGAPQRAGEGVTVRGARYFTAPMAKINLDHFQHEEIPIHKPIVTQRNSRIGLIVLVQRAVGGKISAQ
jgi:hypothetical protein